MMSTSGFGLVEFDVTEFRDRKKVAEGTTSTISVASVNTLTVAIKALKPSSEIEEPLTRERASQDFENELLINARLRHPNIVLLIGFVRTGRLDALVFEYSVKGTPKCADYGPKRLRKGIHICLQVGRALCHAHRLGIVHRDVKPSQILMFGETAKLGDWGLAATVPDGGCKSGETGTWEFMAPEVIRSEPYSETADVYSFSILLSCFLMGSSYPYKDKYLTPSQAAMGVVKTGLRPSLSSTIPDVLKSVCELCWHPDHEIRPTMSGILDMLTESLSVVQLKSSDASSSSWSSWLMGYGA